MRRRAFRSRTDTERARLIFLIGVLAVVVASLFALFVDSNRTSATPRVAVSAVVGDPPEGPIPLIVLGQPDPDITQRFWLACSELPSDLDDGAVTWICERP